MPWIELDVSRGADDAGELALSRDERLAEWRRIPRCDRHAVRQRIELVRAAKGAARRPGQGLTPTELDAVLPPVDCYLTRLRGPGGPGRGRRPVECVHGHPLTPSNTRVRPGGKRECRACNRVRNRQWRLKKKETS